MNRIDAKFEQLNQNGQKALLPYLTAGCPDSDTTARLLSSFDTAGVPFCEIGFPFSDSVADGPVIQGSFYRSLENGLKMDDIFNTVKSVRDSISMGLLAMVSMSIVRRIGIDNFTQRCSEAGFDGLIVPDVPLEEALEVKQVVESAGLKWIMLVAPTSELNRRARIAECSSGFVYQIAVAGITGERATLPPELKDNIASLRKVSGLPVCVGFGISTPEHVAEVCRVADGAIVGSAIIRRITDWMDEGKKSEEIVELTTAFVKNLLEGTR